MHPAIRVFSVIIAIVFLTKPHWNIVLSILCLSLSFLMFKGSTLLLSSLKMLWRLKWLYLSILIVYGWFSPGEAIVTLDTIDAAYIPTVEGLQVGALRVLVLVTIVSMVAGLLLSLERPQLVSAIIFLSKPLSIIGIDSSRFALLLVLTLDKVLVAETTMHEMLSNNQERKGLLNKASSLLKDALLNIEKESEQQQIIEMKINEISAPPLWQWLLPTVFASALYILNYYIV